MKRSIPKHLNRAYDHIKAFKETLNPEHLLAFYTHQGYGRTYSERPKRKWVRKYLVIHNSMDRPKGKSILDVGCATRHIAESIFAENEYKGFDINQRFSPDYIGDAHELSSIVNRSFDVIFLLDILEHVYDPITVLTEASKLADTIVVMTPQMYHLECLPIPKSMRYSEDRHIHVGGAAYWRKKFHCAGLEVLSEEGFYYVPSIAYHSKNKILRSVDSYLDNIVTRFIDEKVFSCFSKWPVIKQLGQESIFILGKTNEG